MLSRVLVAAILLGTVGVPAGSAGASCVGPSISVRPRQAAPNEEVVVRGDAWFTGCCDTGADNCRMKPVEDIDVRLRREGTDRVRIVIENVDANREFDFRASFRVPRGVGPGTYLLAARGGGLRSPQVRFTVLEAG